MKTKIKIIITGHRVLGVGYRKHLLLGAIDLGVSGFEAFNLNDQQITILVSGEDSRVKAFEKFVQSDRPVLTEVLDIYIRISRFRYARTRLGRPLHHP